MPTAEKYDKILDALEELLKMKDMQNITVSDIAAAAGIGKGSVYYYFSSKDAILDALVKRSYEKPLETAKDLAKQTSIPPFTRMAMLFQACRYSSAEFIKRDASFSSSASEQSLLHQKYLNYLVTELKPELTEIIRQGIECGEIHFEYPAALAEIVLIILAVKLDNSLFTTTPEETADTLAGLVALLETINAKPVGTLNFLTTFFKK